MQESDTFLGEGTEIFLSLVQFTQIPPRALSDEHGFHQELQKEIAVCIKDILSWLLKGNLSKRREWNKSLGKMSKSHWIVGNEAQHLCPSWAVTRQER